MSELSPAKFSPQDAAFLHLIGLRYALAGDLESYEALDALMDRVGVIDWNDPAFLKTSDEMRSRVPRLTPNQEALTERTLLSIINSQAELLAMKDENTAINLASLKAIHENTVKLYELHNVSSKRSDALVEVYIRMLGRLEMLGADTEEFRLPKDF